MNKYQHRPSQLIKESTIDFQQAQEMKLPEPEILEIGMRLRFIVYLWEDIPVENIKQPESQPDSQPESELKNELQSELAAKIVVFIEKDAAGKSEIAKMLGQKAISGELNKQVRRLVTIGVIEMTLPGKPNSRFQKYRLTTKGKKMISNLRSNIDSQI